MRSHLTRSVFRQLLSNEGLIIRCPSRPSLPHRLRQCYAQTSIVRPPARRTLWGFSRKPERQTKDAQLAPGLSAMVELSVRERMKSQLPPRRELTKAWIEFFEYKAKKHEAVNHLQAGHALRTYQYLRNVRSGEEKLLHKHLRKALGVLHMMPSDDRGYHAEFARLLYADCYSEWTSVEKPTFALSTDLLYLIRVLVQTGDSREARDLIMSRRLTLREDAIEEEESAKGRTQKFWIAILRGFIEEDNEAELLKSFEMAKGAGMPFNAKIQELLVSYFASKDNIPATKQWYQEPMNDPSQMPYTATLRNLLKFCIRNNELDWCKSIFRDLLATEPPKAIWDVVLQWAAGAMGKGVEDVEKMMEVMIGRLPENEGPDAKTINGLVELAMSFNDSYLAERYITLGQKFGICPNAQTYALQMSYRADANDLRGSQAAYELLQAEEVLKNEDLPAINKYIRALCAAKSVDHNRIASITSDLTEREKRLEADTVVALTKLYLSRDEKDDLVDMIQSECYHYTVEERASVQKVFMDFCMSPDTHVIRSWNAYMILHPLFNEATVAERTLLMNDFFARSRCDMASYVFGHMRAHSIPDRRPELDTYIQCFLGIASCADREALDMVHNMLKMDSNIEPTTALYNSLMQAYTACEDADRALGFWDDITNSREGPSYRSLEVVFWACSRKPFGDTRAREIWSKMRRMEIEVTQEVFSAYVGALAGNVKLDEAKGICEQIPGELGLTVDVHTLVTFYNAIPGTNRKDLVEEWAKDKYTEVWKEVEKLGRFEHEEGHMVIPMKREFKA